jgi:hypothetical protein
VISWSAVEGTLRSAAARSGGAVYVSGRPGGLIRLRGPVVVGTWTTGTPLATPEPSARTGPAVLRRAAMADAIFVIAAGRIEAVREEDEPSTPPVAGELALERALREVRRRLTRLEREGAHRALCPEIDRVRSSTHDSAAVPLTATERAVLELADGRHTLRDIAFRINRGVFAVTLDVMHLLDARLLEVVPDLFEPAPTAQAPEQDGTPTVATLLAPRTAAPAAQPSPQPAAGARPRLAQRVPGANGVGGRSRAVWRPWSLRPDRVRRAGRERDDEQ